MSDKVPGYVVFACGASIKANDVSTKDVGERLVVGTYPHKGHSKPIFDGKERSCCFCCPSTIKLSGRKFHRVVTHEDGSKGMLMTCKITGIIVDDPAPSAPEAKAT